MTAKLSRQENLSQDPNIHRVGRLLGLEVKAFYQLSNLLNYFHPRWIQESCGAPLACAQLMDNMKTNGDAHSSCEEQAG